MKLRGRRDANHAAIVATFRVCGCSVLDLANIGDGCPDILIGRNGVNVLVEIKNGSKPQLTEPEEKFYGDWKGRVEIIRDQHAAANLAASLCL